MQEQIIRCFVALSLESGDMNMYKDATVKVSDKGLVVIDENGIQVYDVPLDVIKRLWIDPDIGVAKELSIDTGTNTVTLQPLEEGDDYTQQYEAELLLIKDALVAKGVAETSPPQL